MSKPVNINYIWNRENIDKLFDASYRYLFNHSAKRYVGWFFIALSQYAMVVAVRKGAFELLLFSTIMLGYWYYGKRLIAKRRAIRSFENSEFKDKHIKIEADEKGLHILSPHQEYWAWEEVDEVMPLGDDIVVYKYPNFHYIPAGAFQNLEEKSRFKTLAKEKGKLQ